LAGAAAVNGEADECDGYEKEADGEEAYEGKTLLERSFHAEEPGHGHDDEAQVGCDVESNKGDQLNGSLRAFAWIWHHLPVKIERVAFYEGDSLYYHVSKGQENPVEVHNVVGPWEAMKHAPIKKQDHAFLNPYVGIINNPINKSELAANLSVVNLRVRKSIRSSISSRQIIVAPQHNNSSQTAASRQEQYRGYGQIVAEIKLLLPVLAHGEAEKHDEYAREAKDPEHDDGFPGVVVHLDSLVPGA